MLVIELLSVLVGGIALGLTLVTCSVCFMGVVVLFFVVFVVDCGWGVWRAAFGLGVAFRGVAA